MSVEQIKKDILSKKIGIDQLPLNDGLKGVLEDYINQINDAMRVKINEQSHAPVSSLANSIKTEKIKDEGATISITTTASDYWKFFDKGVDGLEGKWGAPYSFKFAKPSRSHAEAIREWIPTTGFFKSPQSYESISFAVATNVKKRGLKPKPFVAPILDESPILSEFAKAVLDITGAHIRVIFIDNEKK